MMNVVYAAPLQKLLVVPLAYLVWDLLALAPFILLRFRGVFAVYLVGFSAVLMVLAWDYFVPFHYEAPGFSGTISYSGWGYSSGHDGIQYWVSKPKIPSAGGFMLFIVMISPLVLACIYRVFYPYWTKKSEQVSGGNGREGP